MDREVENALKQVEIYRSEYLNLKNLFNSNCGCDRMEQLQERYQQSLEDTIQLKKDIKESNTYQQKQTRELSKLLNYKDHIGRDTY